MASGIKVSQEAIEAYEMIKNRRGPSIRVLACNPANAEVVLHEKDPAECAEASISVIKNLLREIGAQPVYLLIDYFIVSKNRRDLACVKWIPDECKPTDKLLCASLWEDVKSEFNSCRTFPQFTMLSEFDNFDSPSFWN